MFTTVQISNKVSPDEVGAWAELGNITDGV
jgi:hypothetical protein